MTLDVFNKEYMPIISGIIAFIGLLMIWLQLRRATKVIEHTSNWNRINSTYNFFNLENNTRIEKELYAAGRDINIAFMKLFI